MKRNVLLLEPNYKNKYPPIGLMKLATYHKQLGDNVTFFKGDIKQLIISNIFEDAINKLNYIDPNINWKKYSESIQGFIEFGRKTDLENIINKSSFYSLLNTWLNYYRDYYKKKEYIKYPKYDRICITTLFTFYWKETINTIKNAKLLVKIEDEVHIGGILATVLDEELFQETGIKPHKGLLDRKGLLDNNDIIIDTLPLDYSILYEIDYKYPADDAFYTYTTRGCVNKCSFCAVPILEPEFQSYISINEQIDTVRYLYGDKPSLLLMDNNVLASNEFNKIIDDIKKCGFYKGATFTKPNYLQIFYENLKNGINDRAFMKVLHKLYRKMFENAKYDKKQKIYNILNDLEIFEFNTATKDNLLKAYSLLQDCYTQQLSRHSKRIVDFNQGLDASRLSEKKISLLSEIPIKPLRIAFDSINEETVYRKAVFLCAKYQINSLSNYLLYNYKDKPVELYKRIKINIMLCESLQISIYSFPMKYHPITGEYSKSRDFIGKYWNKKYIRAIQTILNATKGKIGRGKTFFYEAFGKTEQEYKMLLLMPEPYLLYRFFFKAIGYTKKWKLNFQKLTSNEKKELLRLIQDNNFSEFIFNGIKNKNIKNVYKHYLIKRDDILNENTEIGKLKKEYDNNRKI
jgi:hypothetical protein